MTDTVEMLLAGIIILAIISVTSLIAKFHHKPTCKESGGRIVHVGGTVDKQVCVFEGNKVPGINLK